MKHSLLYFVITCIVLTWANAQSMQFSDMTITIKPSATGITKDPLATILSDGSLIYKCKGVVSQSKGNPKTTLEIGEMVSKLLVNLKNIASSKAGAGLAGAYDPSSAQALEVIVNNPKMLEGFFNAILGIKQADWRFALKEGEFVVVFTKLNSGTATESLMLFYFRDTGNGYVSVYKSGISLMARNIICASQEKDSLLVSED